MTYRTFKPGQSVRCTKNGKTYRVTGQDGCQVFVAELINSHIHPANLIAA